MLISHALPQLSRADVIRGSIERADSRLALRSGPTTILGLVEFRTHRGEPAEAILDASGSWSCPALPVLDRVLNALFRLNESEAAGLPPGHAELTRVANWIRGEVRVPRDSD